MISAAGVLSTFEYMNRPIFRDQRSATLEGEVIYYGDKASALNKLCDFWSPNRNRICAPGSVKGPQPIRSAPSSFPAARRRYSPQPQPMFQKVSAIGSATPEGQQEAIPETLPPTEQSQPAEDWHFGFGNSFRKAVDSIDRKLQGRILQALTDIAASPVTNRGDTIKPLSGDMNGFWRYRIGDFRLVYYPDEATHTVTLCDFASRGSAYD